MAATNPFPGMNPYLEKTWRDVHQSMAVYGTDQLQSQLPNDLRARLEIRTFVNGQEGDEPQTESIINIKETGLGNCIFTAIEVLSPANKFPGPGQDLYLKNQAELLRSGVNLVEIDLLRAGERILAIPPFLVPVNCRTPYFVCITRGYRQTNHEIYPLPLREPLPTIRIPLRQTDQDATLNLQALIDLAYRNGGYDDIDYRQAPDPPLDGDDAAWADDLLRGKGLR